jgi:uncharacterized protein YdeI (YjbR/CyaY-like superfamily)
MSAHDPKAEAFIRRAPAWGPEMAALRELALGAGLDEAIKWGKPCYMRGSANVAILQPFKDECRLMFFKGVLLPDPERLLTPQGENTQGALVFRATSIDQIEASAPALKALLAAAIAAEEAGLKVEMKARDALELPAELTARLAGDAELSTAFEALTPGRRREYALHIGAAAKADTREARIDKATPRILAGKGLTDR